MATKSKQKHVVDVSSPKQIAKPGHPKRMISGIANRSIAGEARISALLHGGVLPAIGVNPKDFKRPHCVRSDNNLKKPTTFSTFGITSTIPI